MKNEKDLPPGIKKALGTNPLDADDVLSEFYTPSNKKKTAEKSKPDHYRIVCISLYNEDITRLNEYVAELKKRGHTKANKSQVVREALNQLSLDKIPKIR